LGLELLHFDQKKLYNEKPDSSFFGNKKGGLTGSLGGLWVSERQDYTL
jgi:hypothetical protein